MNNYSIQKFHLLLTVLFLVAIFLPACGPSQAELDATETQIAAIFQATQTAAAPTATNLPPSPTPTPEATPIPTRKEQVEQVTLPGCSEVDTDDETIFHELLESLLPGLYEMESFQYRTIYRYKENDLYPEDELSIEVLGAHSGLLSEPDIGSSYFYPLTSQRYEESHVIQTDLSSDEQTEYIVYPQGFLVRENNDSGWIYFEQNLPGDMLNMAEMLSPQEIIFMLTGGGGLTPGIWTDTPLMAQEESLNQVEVMHRCWILGERSENIDGYLIHYESLYTFLMDVEVHIWTAENDTHLVRLAITGTHNEERLSEYDFLEHDTPRDFLLWMDLYDVGNEIEIEEPSQAAITLTVSDSDLPTEAIVAAPHNELPLPEDAESPDLKFFNEESEPAIPREYLWPYYESTNSALEIFAGSNWYDIPDDRFPEYQTNLDQAQVISFYLDEMEQRGWNLDNIFLQLGWSRLFLIFKRDQVSQVIILEDGEHGSTHITAILPPDEELLAAIINGWTSYNEDNSELLSDAVKSIAFDERGNVWIGSENTGGWSTFSSDGTTHEDPEIDGGISVFDGNSWMHYTTSNSELLSNDIATLNIDSNDQVWISTNEGLSTFDGETWTAYNDEDYGLGLITEIAIDNDDNVWLSGWNEISVYDGQEWESFRHLHSIMAFDIDPDGRLLITTGESVYARDGNDWIELFTSEDEPTNINLTGIINLQFDSVGRLWVLSRNEGLMMFDGESWVSYFPEDNGLDIGYFEDMGIDHQDRVWLVSLFGGVYMFDLSDGWYDYTPNPIGISTEYPETLNVDQDGRIWIGSRHGIAVFTPPES